MKLKLTKNWIAKFLSLLMATGIWFLIKSHLTSPSVEDEESPFAPRAMPVDENTLKPRR